MRRWPLLIGIIVLALMASVSAAAIPGTVAGSRQLVERHARAVLDLTGGAKRPQNAVALTVSPSHRCLAPRLVGLTLRRARDRAATAGCRLRLEGAPVRLAAVQTVVRQSPQTPRTTAPVTVWLNPLCSRSALAGPPENEPLVTPGPTRLLSGLFVEGGPALIFSTPHCRYRPGRPWAGTLTVTNPATGAIVAARTVASGELATFALAPGAYALTGTFATATVNGAHMRATQTVTVPVDKTVRQDIVAPIP
jgi:hypothetical protein